MDHAVLLVDDDENLLSGLTRALRKQPFQIYTARNGEEATWILKTRNINVLVTDENMPGMCGADLAAWVADNCPAGHADHADRPRRPEDGHASDQRTRRMPLLHQAVQRSPVGRGHSKGHRTEGCPARQSADARIAAAATSRVGAVPSGLRIPSAHASEDLHGPLQTLLNCCRRLRERLEDCARPRSSPAPDRRRQRRDGVPRGSRPVECPRLL